MGFINARQALDRKGLAFAGSGVADLRASALLSMSFHGVSECTRRVYTN